MFWGPLARDTVDWIPEVPMIRIRRATTDDAATLTAIAHAAKRHWGYPEQWIESWSDQLTLSAAYLRDRFGQAAQKVLVAGLELVDAAVGVSQHLPQGVRAFEQE